MTAQTYEAWRISYQSSEQAARAAFARAQELEGALAEMHEFFQPNAWGSADNRRDALNNAALALGIEQEKSA